jgi:hypothetical protein
MKMTKMELYCQRLIKRAKKSKGYLLSGLLDKGMHKGKE